jgi:hypothetical protein
MPSTFAFSEGAGLASGNPLGISRVVSPHGARRISARRYGLKLELTPPSTAQASAIRVTVDEPGLMCVDWRPGEGARVRDLRVTLCRSMRRRARTTRYPAFPSAGKISRAAVRIADSCFRHGGDVYDPGPRFTTLRCHDASSVPCFDQPDLKARFDLAVTRPRAGA